MYSTWSIFSDYELDYVCMCAYIFVDVKVCIYGETIGWLYIFFSESLACLLSETRTLGSLIEPRVLAGNETTVVCMSPCHSTGFPGMNYHHKLLIHEYYASKLMHAYTVNMTQTLF